MSHTTDPTDPRLTRGGDKEPTDQAKVYLILSEEEIAKGFTRPVRTTYVHSTCGGVTTMSRPIAETYARDPYFYGYTYCVSCHQHLPVSEFKWYGSEDLVGS